MFSLRIHSLEEEFMSESASAGMSESSSTNTTMAAVEDIFKALDMNGQEDAGEVSDLRGPTKAVRFSSGNPRVEEIRGVMHLFRNVCEPPGALESLPAGRKNLVCVLAVPNYMTYADFCQFSGSFIQNVLEMRIVRNDGLNERYSILMTFDNQKSADDFYRHYNRRPFSSLEAEICHVLFIADVQFTGSFEHASTPPTGLTELPTCPVCLERLDQHISGILTTVCNHSFHTSCISKWTDSSCPVCRYCQQQPEKSTCSVCSTSENLWICVICGFVGCGRYKSGHAIKHWKETQHCYSLELETQCSHSRPATKSIFIQIKFQAVPVIGKITVQKKIPSYNIAYKEKTPSPFLHMIYGHCYDKNIVSAESRDSCIPLLSFTT